MAKHAYGTRIESLITQGYVGHLLLSPLLLEHWSEYRTRSESFHRLVLQLSSCFGMEFVDPDVLEGLRTRFLPIIATTTLALTEASPIGCA